MRVRGSAVLLGLVLAVFAAGPVRASCDSGFAQQWGLAQIGAPAAWAKSTGTGIKIGIVDTGIDLNHEDLKTKIVASKCFGSTSECAHGAQDDHGHGTHVAGIAAATKDNGMGVAGVAPDAQLVIAKALFKDGEDASGSATDISAGIRWVADQGAKVVNLSLGGNFVVTNLFGSGFSDAIEYAWGKGAVVVLAAGNTNYAGLGSQNYGDLDAIVVGATGPTGAVASSYSSPIGNAKWGIVAPGGDSGVGCPDAREKCILSTYWQAGSTGNVYGYLEGTSMAAPHVSGTAALLFRQGLTRDQVVQQILNTAAVLPCGSSCHGRLDAAKAVGAGATPAPSACPGTGGATTTTRASGASNTTRTTRAPRAAATTVPNPDTTGTLPDNPEDSTSTTGTILSDDEVAPQSLPPTKGRPKDEPDGPLVVGAALLLFGAGGMAAPLAWRRFFGAR
jgi:serine protease